MKDQIRTEKEDVYKIPVKGGMKYIKKTIRKLRKTVVNKDN